MLLAAIQHCSTSRDCFCLTPRHFRLRLRSAAGDLHAVTLHHQDKYLPLSIADTRAAVSMRRVTSDGILDYWEADVAMDLVCLRYWFELTDTQGKTMYYSNFRFSCIPFTDTDDMFDCPQNLREEERFLTPEWAKNKVLYQVFPSRFSSSRQVPDSLWYKAPVSFTDDLHGDLRGIIDHLPHLKELGVDILYMTPIFRSDSCHKYDTIDYYTVEPTFGTKEELKELVNRAHALGLRVILDGVFNHTSRDFFAFRDILQKGWASEYLDWYFINGYPLKADWGEKPNYKTFSYFGGMPKLNIRNPAVTRYVLDVALYWLRECGIDGWRLDVGDEIGHAFWKQFRREIKAEFPDALIVGEVWHYAEDFLRGDEWDTVMNYPFYQALIALLGTCTISVSEYAGRLAYLRGQYPPNVYPLLWNLADSHDTPRLLHHCDGDKARMKLAAALQLLEPGMPMIYYGDEYAMEGGQDPDCRRGMLWDESRQDAQMFSWYQALLRTRRGCPELLQSDVPLQADDSRALLMRLGAGTAALFHCAEGELPLPQWEGCEDLLTGKPFRGTLGSFGCAVLKTHTI